MIKFLLMEPLLLFSLEYYLEQSLPRSRSLVAQSSVYFFFVNCVNARVVLPEMLSDKEDIFF